MRVLAAAFAALLAALSPAARAETLTIDGGKAPLEGTLLMPETGEDLTAVLLVAGSGPNDRNGNQPGMTPDTLKLLAEALVARGHAVLRADKRGVGASAAAAPAEAELRFTTYVADTVAWATRLAAQPRVGRIVLLGHSEGALIVTLAAQSVETAGVVLVAGAGRKAGDVLREQLAAQGLPPDLKAQSDHVLATLEAGQTVDAPAELAALFRPSVQPYLISWLPIDPAGELAKLAVPVLIVQGTTDIQIGLGDFERLTAAKPEAETLLITGMNHVLKSAPPDRQANIMTYLSPTIPLAPGLVEGIDGFLTGLAAR